MQDTWKGDPWRPWTQNLYVYVGNNPVNNVDPTGHWPEWVDKGKDFMKQVYDMYPGFTRNTQPFSTSRWGDRIPDIVNSRVIGEIKNVAYQHLSSQMKGFLEIAEKTQKQFVLVVKEGTKLSAPLIAAVKDAGGVIIEVDKGVGQRLISVPMVVPEQWLEDMMNQYGSGNMDT